MPAELSPTQESVLLALKELNHNSGPVTAREIAECLVAGLGGTWYQTHVYDALYRLAQKNRVRRVGWDGAARTWKANDA